MAKEKKTVYEELYAFQTRLQGVANDLGIKLAAVVSSTDKDVLDVLTKELPKGQKKSIEGEIRRLKEITDAVEKVREKGFDTAKDTLFSTSLDVAKAGTSETAKEFNAALGEAARKEREQRFCKTLNDKQLKAIIDGQGIDGATIGDWFSGWQRDDLERISRAVQTATVEQMTVPDIAKLIRGTKENDYNDGILATTRVGAVRLARTVVNGVCNNARVETIKENSDVIDGIKFVGTLDGKTCPHCASYDGHIWRGEDMATARRPPIHPNCRCTLVPYVELKDDDGNVVDIDNERPAANADFDQLAKDAYDEKAREKGWKRRFEDLSPSTRLKYYYQAQKDYEKETGKPAYRQVDSNLSFSEYFKQQPDSFKRDWLGAKRYEAYKDGKLTEKAIFAPDLAYTVSPSSLVKFVEPEVPDELAKLIDEYEKKGSPELPDPTSGKSVDYTKFVPDYDGETNVDTLRKRWEKLDLQELEKLSDDIWERSKAWRSYIWDFQPKKEDFSTEKDYDKAYEDYLHAYHHVFWGQLDDVVRELIEEAKKKTTVPEIDYSQYKPTFRDSSDVDTILQSLQTSSLDELTKIRKEVFDEYLKWGLYFNQFQPDPKDYATKEEHGKAWELWHEFKTNNDREFWHRILDGIDALKEQKEKEIERGGKTGKVIIDDYKTYLPKYKDISDVAVLQSKWEPLEISSLRNVLVDVRQKRSDWEKTLFSVEPKGNNFQSKKDFETAWNNWNKVRNDGFWNQLIGVLSGLIEKRKKNGSSKKATAKRMTYANASYNGSTDVKSLLQSWEALGEDELTALQEDIKSKGNTWNKQLTDSYPTRSAFETQESYQDSVEQWNKIYSQGQTFWSKLQNGVSKLIKTLKDKASGKKTQKDKVDPATVKTENAEKTNGFQHPFDSIMAPDDYLKNQKTKEELDRINKQYSKDLRTYGIDEALEKKRERLRSLILPLPPDEKVEKDLHSRLPKQFKGRNITQDKRTDEFVQATKDGLTFVARLLRNLGRDEKSLKFTKIAPMLEQRAFYSLKQNKVHLSYSSRKTKLSIGTTAAHEFGHALDNKGSGKVLKKIHAFYEQHSKKDLDGNYIYFYRNGEKCRELDINVPSSYVCREYELWNGTRQTELTSMFSETLYSSPETFFDPQYREYYTGVLQCLKTKK